MIATANPGISPPAAGTGVWQNGVELPDVVGGPDLIAVDLLNGANAYGYQNSVTSFTNWSMTIGSNGIDTNSNPTLQNILTGFNVGRIELLGNDLFTDRGEVFSIFPAVQVGAFTGGSDFVIDPGANKLFSITTSGSTQTIHSYSLSSFQSLGTDTVTGISGSTSDLTRFGTDGLAFVTSNNQVVLVHSALVPEPTSFVLMFGGALSIGLLCYLFLGAKGLYSCNER